MIGTGSDHHFQCVSKGTGRRPVQGLFLYSCFSRSGVIRNFYQSIKGGSVMRQKIFRRNPAMVLVFIFFLGLVWAACSTSVEEKRGEPAQGEEKETSTYRAKYYHFEDVLIPEELNYQQSKSAIYETPKFKMGWMVFSKWRLDVKSLIDFFTYHMEKDNWKLVNSFTGKESVLNFSKPDKTCTIRITESWLGKTEVEIRVGPLGEKKM
jgi:hypothetical protein